MERRRPTETLEKKILSCPCNLGMSEKHSESLQHKSLVDLTKDFFGIKKFFFESSVHLLHVHERQFIHYTTLTG